MGASRQAREYQKMIQSDLIAVSKVSLKRGIEYQHETGLCVIWRDFRIVCYLMEDLTDIQTNDVEGTGFLRNYPERPSHAGHQRPR